MIKHNLAGRIPLAQARQVISTEGGVAKTVERRLQGLLATPFFAVRDGDLVHVRFNLLHGDKTQATERLHRRRAQGAERAARYRERRNSLVNRMPQTPPPVAVKAKVTRIKHHPQGPVKNFKKISKHPAPQPACLPQAAHKKELTGLGAILGQVLPQAPVACQAAPRPAVAVAPAPAPAPSPAPAPTPVPQEWQAPGLDAETAALLARMQVAQAALPQRPTPPARPLAAPPRPAAPQPKPVAPAAPQREPQGQSGGVPAAYSWRKLNRGWFEDTVAHRCPGADYRAFAAIGASPQLLLHALVLIESATQKLRNPPAVLYRACQRLQAGTFAMQQRPGGQGLPLAC